MSKKRFRDRFNHKRAFLNGDPQMADENKELQEQLAREKEQNRLALDLSELITIIIDTLIFERHLTHTFVSTIVSVYVYDQQVELTDKQKQIVELLNKLLKPKP